ncbi:MAG: S41 family peptidase [Eubacteriales bacterium]|jgi:carboxyl-terminal processing protease|nr:S41 family peptidase [Eubacteriales bacterium]
MFKKIPLATTLVLILLAVLVTFQITYLSITNKYEKQLNDLEAGPQVNLYNKLDGVDELFRSLYIGEIDEDQLADEIIRGYIQGTGDAYAQYMNSDEFKQFMNDLGGELEGIGIVVIYNEEYKALEIASVMPDSPALEAGLMPGDLIIEVDDLDVSILGYYGAVARMQGSADTYANFTAVRNTGNGNYNERKTMSVKRGYITEQTIISHMYNDGTNSIGIVKILQFDTGTPEQFIAAVEGLQSQGADKLIFDVRNNSGGELNSVVGILDYLLPEGPVIRITDGEGNETVMNSDADETDAKMAVLVNRTTASAAELFAAAIRDYGKAFLVGNQTYGKGSMQTIVRLADNSALRVTYKMYSPPFSDNYHGVGLTPDYIIDQSPQAAQINLYTIDDSEDTQLQEAINRIKSE